MAKCLTINQKDSCPNGSVDAKCVPYTGVNLPNIGALSGQKLDAILAAINTIMGGGSPLGLKIVPITLSNNGTYPLPAGGWSLGISLNPASTLAAFKVGITNGGNELIFDQIVVGGVDTTFNVSYYSSTSTTLYIGGITSVTNLKLLML